MQGRKNPIRAAVTLGGDLVRSAAMAVADNPPSLSAIALSVALAFLLRFHARQAWAQGLKLE